MALIKNQTIPLTISSISNDGNGVGRHEGQAVFVPYSAVGDVLEVKIVKAAQRYAYGRIEKIVAKSVARIEEDCPISKVCGGCNFRHMTYTAELLAKQSFVQDALSRIGGLSIEVLPVVPSPLENRYRNKVQYPAAQDDSGNLIYGFYALRSHRLVQCKDCLLQPDLLNKIANKVAQLLQLHSVPAYNERTKKGTVRHIYLRHAQSTNKVMVCLVLAKNKLPNAKNIAQELCDEFAEIDTVVLNINSQDTNVICGDKNLSIIGSGELQDTLCGVPIHISPLSFSQVNSAGAQKLFQIVQQYANMQKHETLLDLYCGAGVIGLSMAKDCKSLIGIEIVPNAVEGAKRSAKEMGIENAQFYCEDAASAAKRMAENGEQIDVIVIDPPRKGCDEATLTAVVQMQPKRVVMISCNPATLARDIAYLAKNAYAATIAQPVDMFPRTRHVECVVLLNKCEV